MTTTGGFHEENGVHPIHPFGAAACSAANTGGRKRGMLKRLMVVAALMLLVVSAGAVATLAHDDREQTIVRPREFTLPTERGPCSQLPVGLVVQGQGIERTKIEIDSGDKGDKHHGDRHEGHADEDEGGASQSVSTRITGTATDNLGGSYRFSYSNRFKTPLPGSGIMIDRFSLTGSGAASGLSTFFRARVTADSQGNLIGFEILKEAGDPFGCDPL